MSNRLAGTDKRTDLTSVVIPTHNRPGGLEACLAGLAAQRLSAECFEVVVVDDGGSIDVGEVVDRHQGSLSISLSRRAHAGPAAARNAGAELARGRLLAFTDDDCIPDPAWLGAMAAAVERSPECLVGGMTENALAANPFSEASQSVIGYLYAEGLRRTGELPFVASNNLALDHELFDRMEGFDESFREAAAEDRDLSARCKALGGSLVYEPAALVRHAHPLGPWSLLRQYIAYGRGARQLERSRGQAHEAPTVRPCGFYAGMLLDPFRRHPPARAVVVASLVALTQIGTAIGYARGCEPSPHRSIVQKTGSDHDLPG